MCFNNKIGSRISVNEQVAEELHKPVIKKLKRRKVYVIDVSRNMHWLNFLKIKRVKQFLMLLSKFANEFNRKTNKLRLDQGGKFYNNLILMYSTHIEGNSVIAERFIKTLKAKTYKKVTPNDNKSYLP